jgi:hypothetical protein
LFKISPPEAPHHTASVPRFLLAQNRHLTDAKPLYEIFRHFFTLCARANRLTLAKPVERRPDNPKRLIFGPDNSLKILKFGVRTL